MTPDEEHKELQRQRIRRETEIVAGCVIAMVSAVAFVAWLVWTFLETWKKP